LFKLSDCKKKNC